MQYSLLLYAQVLCKDRGFCRLIIESIILPCYTKTPFPFPHYSSKSLKTARIGRKSSAAAKQRHWETNELRSKVPVDSGKGLSLLKVQLLQNNVKPIECVLLTQGSQKHLKRVLTVKHATLHLLLPQGPNEPQKRVLSIGHATLHPRLPRGPKKPQKNVLPIGHVTLHPFLPRGPLHPHLRWG